METTLLLSKIIGPVLILRGISILINRSHFVAMLEGLEAEAKTVSFSSIPVGLMMAGLAVGLTHTDTSSLAAIILHLIAWGMVAKASLLMVFPSVIVKKAKLIGQLGFLNVVCLMTTAIGCYLTWFGYFG